MVREAQPDDAWRGFCPHCKHEWPCRFGEIKPRSRCPECYMLGRIAFRPESGMDTVKSRRVPTVVEDPTDQTPFTGYALPLLHELPPDDPSDDYDPRG